MLPRLATILMVVPLLALPLGLGGCVERRIEITSEPSGALVWLNDQQVGRTPTQAAFLYHGVYDIRVELEGFEPLRTEAEAKAPLYENAPLDLFAEALPMRIDNVQRWHFVLEPSLESTLGREEFEGDLLTRAAAMRGELESTGASEAAEPGAEPGAEPAASAESGASDEPSQER